MCPDFCDYNCTDLPDHEQVICQEYPKGGIYTIGILECDQTTITDFTSVAEANAAIAAGDLHLMVRVKAMFPDASPVEGENVIGCGADTILDALDNVLEIKDFNVTDGNDAFYEALNGRQTHLIWFECANLKLRVVEFAPVTWVNRPAEVPESDSEKQKYNLTAKWRSAPSEFPVLYDAPAGVYD